jgi:uncharacterized protein YuzE
MKITYVKDTDTLLIRFNQHEVAETKNISNEVVIELDKTGNMVNLTVRHAHNHTRIADFCYNQVDAMRAL